MLIASQDGGDYGTARLGEARALARTYAAEEGKAIVLMDPDTGADVERVEPEAAAARFEDAPEAAADDAATAGHSGPDAAIAEAVAHQPPANDEAAQAAPTAAASAESEADPDFAEVTGGPEAIAAHAARVEAVVAVLQQVAQQAAWSVPPVETLRAMAERIMVDLAFPPVPKRARKPRGERKAKPEKAPRVTVSTQLVALMIEPGGATLDALTAAMAWKTPVTPWFCRRAAATRPDLDLRISGAKAERRFALVAKMPAAAD